MALSPKRIIAAVCPELSGNPSLPVFLEMSSGLTDQSFLGKMRPYAIAYRACHLFMVSGGSGGGGVGEAAFPGVFESKNADGGLSVHSKNGLEAFSMSSSDGNIEFPSLGFYAVYAVTKTGAIVVPIGALNEIVSKVNGLDSAVNYASGVTGRAMESDAELHMRLGARQKQARSNEIAIQNELPQMPGVAYVKVYSNRGVTERSGRPQRSYESVRKASMTEPPTSFMFPRYLKYLESYLSGDGKEPSNWLTIALAFVMSFPRLSLVSIIYHKYTKTKSRHLLWLYVDNIL
jgi:hypothetical protein